MTTLDEIKNLYASLSKEDQLTFLGSIGLKGIKNALLSGKSYPGISKKFLHHMLKMDGFLYSLKLTDDELYLISLNFDPNLITHVRGLNKEKISRWFDKWTVESKEYFRKSVKLIAPDDINQNVCELLYNQYNRFMTEDQLLIFIRQFSSIASYILKSSRCSNRMAAEFVLCHLHNNYKFKDEALQRGILKEIFGIMLSDNFKISHTQYIVENVIPNNFGLGELKELRTIFLSLSDEDSSKSMQEEHYNVLFKQYNHGVLYNLIPTRLAEKLNSLGMNIFIPNSQVLLNNI